MCERSLGGHKYWHATSNWEEPCCKFNLRSLYQFFHHTAMIFVNIIFLFQTKNIQYVPVLVACMATKGETSNVLYIDKILTVC